MQSDQYVRDGGREDSRILNPPFGLFICARFLITQPFLNI